MTRRETAAWLRVSESQLDTWVREAGLPRIKIGRTVRFDRGQVQQWLLSFTEGVCRG